MRVARVIPVLRIDSVEQARSVIDCLLDAGFTTVEITLTTPRAVQLIGELRSRVPQSFLVGAGTVLNKQQAQQCLDAGADYLVSPCTIRGIAGLAHDAGCAVLLGAFTPSEVHAASQEGSDIVKLFPASSGGQKRVQPRPAVPGSAGPIGELHGLPAPPRGVVPQGVELGLEVLTVRANPGVECSAHRSPSVPNTIP